jgi:oligoendopeptidase F
VLYAEYRDRGQAFVDPYLELLSTGGAASPTEQLGVFGVDLTDRATWDRGLDEMERMLEIALAD